MKLPKYVGYSNPIKEDRKKRYYDTTSPLSETTVCDEEQPVTNTKPILLYLFFSFFLYGFVVIIQNLQADFEELLPPSNQQRFLDGHIPFLPPKRDGSDISLPSRLAGRTATAILEPTLGSHRYYSNAIFSVADGVELEKIVLFVTSLRESGFEGDIVLSASSREHMAPNLFDFLKYHSRLGLVLYEGVVEFEEPPHRFNETNNTKVYLKGLYGSETEPIIEDPRRNRPLSVARFELFWIWSTRYSPMSKIVLIDAKDTYFQLSPEFEIADDITCPIRESSQLYLYEGLLETREIEDKAMIKTAYNKNVYDIMSYLIALIPSATHGDQVAIEKYLCAMVAQFDKTQCIENRCEWAMHNFIYYFGVLQGVPGIDNITVSMQGTGSVNIVDSSGTFRTFVNESFAYYDSESGLLHNRRMGYGSFPSWAIHQYDLDPVLNATIYQKAMDITSKLDYQGMKNSTGTTVYIQPTMGFHRKEKDAIFTVADGISLEDLLLFVISLRKTGFDGDIVLTLSAEKEMKDGVFEFVKTQINSGLVVYTGIFSSTDDDYYNFTPPVREVDRFDVFLAWSSVYSACSQILLLAAENSYFQENPFIKVKYNSSMPQLHFFKESSSVMAFYDMDIYFPDIANAMRIVMENREYSMDDKRVLTPNAILGLQFVIHEYLQEMQRTFHRTNCYVTGCDWAVHNYIWYLDYHLNGVPNNRWIVLHTQGTGVVNPIQSVSEMKAAETFTNTNLFLNWDFQPSPVIINFQGLTELKDFFDLKKEECLSELESLITREWILQSS